MMKMKLLFINPGQYGHYAGYYHYCQILRHQYSIDFVCLDEGFEKVGDRETNIYYVDAGKVNWRINFFKYVQRIDFKNYDFVFITYFKGVSFLRFFSVPYHSVLDIRTGNLAKNRIIRKLNNTLIKLETSTFKYTSILSHSLADKLGFTNYFYLPLGSVEIDQSEKKYQEIKLLYVGTLFKRNIHQTVEALNKFYEYCPEANFSYDIIGHGSEDDIEKLTSLISKYSLEKKIKFHGRIQYQDLWKFYKTSSYGLSYIPQTDYFDCQPATKTYEYILSGLVCIATRTKENIAAINNENGILIDDNPDSLFEVLKQIMKGQHNFNCEKVKNSLVNHKWPEIIKNNFIPMIEKVSNENLND